MTEASISFSAEWRALRDHAQQLDSVHLRDLFEDDPHRAERYVAQVGDVTLDWSRHLVTDRTMELLVGLADRAGVSERIAALFAGEPVNVTENRPALHTALRASPPGVAAFDDDAPGPTDNPAARAAAAAALTRDRVRRFVDGVRSGAYRGATGQPIRVVVNVGIGGSDLGPRMVCEALKSVRSERIECRFVSNADPADLRDQLVGLDPAKTLFVVVSKTFTTAETLANARAARHWITSALGPQAATQHIAAVTAAAGEAAAFGVHPDRIFEMWDWVGGRYSLASAVGLVAEAAIGSQHFEEMLAGMRLVDQHFATAPLASNAPVVAGLLAVWCRNFLGLPSRAVLPYSQRLSHLPAYLQQLEMESNGKRVRSDGQPTDYHTAPVVWGAAGTGGEHSFHQLLHQGTTAVPVDFIAFAMPDLDVVGRPGAKDQHDLLLAHCLAQAAALAFGTPPSEEATTGPATEVTDAHRELPGNRPSTLITAPRLTPSVLGQIVALYEHQVFVQGAVWGINSFDQFGVEHGKHLAKSILPKLTSPDNPPNPPSPTPDAPIPKGPDSEQDPATQASLTRLHQTRKN